MELLFWLPLHRFCWKPFYKLFVGCRRFHFFDFFSRSLTRLQFCSNRVLYTYLQKFSSCNFNFSLLTTLLPSQTCDAVPIFSITTNKVIYKSSVEGTIRQHFLISQIDNVISLYRKVLFAISHCSLRYNSLTLHSFESSEGNAIRAIDGCKALTLVVQCEFWVMREHFSFTKISIKLVETLKYEIGWKNYLDTEKYYYLPFCIKICST